MAGRASVEYYVGQALKGRVIDEDAFVMRIFSNGFVVFVPRFGIEGLIRLRDMLPEGGAGREPDSMFDAENYSLEITLAPPPTGKAPAPAASKKVELFGKVKVRITDEADETSGKRKIKLQLV
jgi:exosome complex exonuclease DIS3/RRP44